VGSKDEVSWKNRGEHSTSELLGRLIWWWLVIVGSGRIGDCVYFAKLKVRKERCESQEAERCNKTIINK
jgi:hypothetical protein